jgi:hypothetical protein
MIHKGGYEVNGYNDPNCMFQYQDVPRDTVAIATPNVWCFHNTFTGLHISNLWLRKPTDSMHSQPHAAHLNFDQPWGVQLVFCSLSPYDEVLGDFSEKKGGWPNMFFKDFWAFMGRNTRILSFTVPFRSKITLAEGSFWSFLCGTDWWGRQLLCWRPRTSFRCHPPLVDNLFFSSSTWGCGMFGMSLLV